MPMGFKNSPADFQRLMDRVLAKEIGKSCIVYVYAILVFGMPEKEHNESFNKVVKLLVDAGFRANIEKLEYAQSDVKFLGYLISSDEIRPALDRKEVITKYGIPKCTEEVQIFLGLVTGNSSLDVQKEQNLY